MRALRWEKDEKSLPMHLVGSPRPTSSASARSRSADPSSAAPRPRSSTTRRPTTTTTTRRRTTRTTRRTTRTRTRRKRRRRALARRDKTRGIKPPPLQLWDPSPGVAGRRDAYSTSRRPPAPSSDSILHLTSLPSISITASSSQTLKQTSGTNKTPSLLCVQEKSSTVS